MSLLYIYEKDNKRRPAIEIQCQYCKKPFLCRKDYIDKGKPRKYCSIPCADNARKNQVLLHCANCGQSFERSKSRLKNSKSGLYFCSRKCKDLAQRIDSHILAIQPPHYGNGFYTYRSIAFRHYPHECELCGYKKDTRLLDVHHIDSNRLNNVIENLMILCPTCHAGITRRYYFLENRRLIPRNK